MNYTKTDYSSKLILLLTAKKLINAVKSKINLEE